MLSVVEFLGVESDVTLCFLFGRNVGHRHCCREQVCGIIENSVAEKAVGHGLGAERVAEYMQEDFSTVTEDEDLYRIMEIILGERQRLVPVLRGQEMVGVITRTDLINLLVQEPARFPDSLFRREIGRASCRERV